MVIWQKITVLKYLQYGNREKSVGRDFYCNNNQLTSLQGAPENIGGCIYCNVNQLTSLQGAPENARIYSI